MVCFLFTFLLTTALYGLLTWLAIRRVTRRPEGARALAEVLILLLGKEYKPEIKAAAPTGSKLAPKPEAKADPKKITGTLV